MNSSDLFQAVQEAIKQINDVEESIKLKGLDSLREVLSSNDSRLVELGYNHVIFKELIKMTQFESGICLEKALDLLQNYYFELAEHHDNLAETLIYRVARSTDFQVCRICLNRILILIDSSDERIAKHSKQILKLADLNDMKDLNPVISEILTKIKGKLPMRRKL